MAAAAARGSRDSGDGPRRHYLDHASTSPPRPEVVEAVRAWYQSARGHGGDPGRVHSEGRAARVGIEEAREAVAALVGARPRQVVFTSGATEAVNAAVWGMTRAAPGAPVVCAAVEHSCVREASARLAAVVPVAVDGAGRIDPTAVEEAVAAVVAETGAPPALVHCQLVNHEVGTVQPVVEVVEVCRRHGAPVHVDAAAGAGLVPAMADQLGADLVSVSAHKLGGPPGVGALVLRRGLRIEPLLVGGEQERRRRGGFEDGPAISGFGAAAGVLTGDGGRRMASEAAAAGRLSVALAAAALAEEGVRLLGPAHGGERAPHIVCVEVAGVEAEPVLIGLDQAGIAAHSGSACSSESLAPSPVLGAMGADPERSLRLSVGWSSVEGDVTAFAGAFSAVLGRLRALRSGTA